MSLLAPPRDAAQRLRAALEAHPNDVQVLELPSARYLMIDGLGPPDASAFEEAVHTLYGLTYALRYELRQAGHPNEPMMPLEAIWRSTTGELWNPTAPHEWHWTVMLYQPPAVTTDLLRLVREQQRARRPSPAIGYARLETFEQGLVAQILHVGPYETEGPTLLRLQADLVSMRYRADGPHHEVYLNTPPRTPREQLRTIIRQAIRRAE